MRQASTLINLDQPQTKQERQTITAQHIERLWVRMAEAYGHKWLSSYGERDEGTWLVGLQGLTPQQLADGLNRVATNGSAWPPSLPEFRQLCIGDKKKQFGIGYIPQVYREQPASEVRRLENTASKKTRETAMQTIKKLLRVKA